MRETNGSIYKLANGKWLARCGIQDGIERKVCATEDEARRWVRDTERLVNGNREVRKKDVPAYQEVQVLETRTKYVPLEQDK